MPSLLDDFRRWQQAQQAPPPTGQREAERLRALADALSAPRPIDVETALPTRIARAVFEAPEVVRQPARALAERLTTPRLDQSEASARRRGFLAGAIEGAAELLSPFNVASTALPILAPVRWLRAVAPLMSAGGGALAGMSMAQLQEAAQRPDASVEEILLPAASAAIGALGGLPSAIVAQAPPSRPAPAPRMPPRRVLHPSRALPETASVAPPPEAPRVIPLGGEVIDPMTRLTDQQLHDAFIQAAMAGQTDRLRPLAAEVQRRAAAPPRALPPGITGAPDVPRTPGGGIPVPPRLSVRWDEALTGSDEALSQAFAEAWFRGDREAADALGAEIARRTSGRAPAAAAGGESATGAAEAAPMSEAGATGNLAPIVDSLIGLPRSVDVLGRRVREILIEQGQPWLLWGSRPEERMRVPWEVANVVAEQAGFPAFAVPATRRAAVAGQPGQATPVVGSARAATAGAGAAPSPPVARTPAAARPAGAPTQQALVSTDVAARRARVPESLEAPVSEPGAARKPSPRPLPGILDLEEMLQVRRPAQPAPTATQPGQLPVPPVEPVDAATLRVDPQTFQFKESDARGVTGSLRGVEKWEPTSPPIMVYERADGTRFVADGHQRFHKYLELQARGHTLPPLMARVFREVDGWTVPEIVRLASLRNIQEGSAQPLDIARLVWNGGQLTADELARVPKSFVVGERLARGQALGNIRHPVARQMIINKQVDPDFASFVGKYIEDPDQQLAAIQRLAKMDLDNLRQAEDAVLELAQGDFEQMSLLDMFGGQDISVPLAETKAKLADAARRALHEQRAAFAGAVRHAASLQQAGNILVEGENLRNLSEARQLLALFDLFARAKGTATNAALTEAARSVVRGDTQPAAHLADILAAVRRDLASGITPERPQPAAQPTVAPHPGGPGEPSGGSVGVAEADTPAGGGAGSGPERAVTPSEAAGGRPGGAGTEAQAGSAGLAPTKRAALGEYLAPPGKDYIFIRISREVAEAHPELRQRLKAEGYKYRRSQGAWFKNLAETTDAERAAQESLAETILGGPVADEASRAAAGGPGEAEASSSWTPEVAEGRSAGEVINEFGETERRLFTEEEVAPLTRQPTVLDVAGMQDLLRAAFRRHDDPNATLAMKADATQDILGLADELKDVANQLDPDVLARLTTFLREHASLKRKASPQRAEAEARLAPFAAAHQARGGEAPAEAGPAPLFGGHVEVGGRPTRSAEAGEGRVPTSRAIPPNVRSFLRRQLGYTDEQIDAMTPDEAIEAGRARRRPPGRPAPGGEGGPTTPEPPQAAPRAQPEAPPPSPREARTLEELLGEYIERTVPTKIARMAERGKAAQPALARQRVPLRETFRGGVEPTPDMPQVPARLEPPYEPPAGRAAQLATEGRTAEDIEAALLAEAKARAAAKAQAPPRTGRLTAAEAEARGLEPPGPPEREPLLPAGTREDRARAAAMRALIDKGDERSLQTYERLLTEQIVREAEQTARAGTKAEWDTVKRWGDTLSRLKPDKATGEYLGSGFGALAKFHRENPALFWRTVGGTAMGLILGDEEGFDGPALIGSGLIGGAIGAALSPAALRRLAPRARAAMPAVARTVQRLWREAKADARETELMVRRPRDYQKDIGFFAQFWRSVPAVEPDLYRDLFKIAYQEQQALQAAKSPEMRALLRRTYTRALVREIRAAAKIAQEDGFAREARYLQHYADQVAGAPRLAARFLSRLTAGELTPQRLENVFRLMEDHVYRNLIGLAVDTGLVNRTQVLMNLPRLGLRYTLKGVKAGRTPAGRAQARQAGMHFEIFDRAQYPEPIRPVVDALDRIAMAPMNWSEEANRADTYLGAFQYAKAKGYSDEAANDFAIDLTSQTQAIPGRLAGNPYLRELGPLRALAKFPTLMAEFFVDSLTHPDKRVAVRLIGMMLGATGLTALTGWHLVRLITPRVTLLGPAADFVRAIASEEERRHVTQYLPGGTPPSHRFVEDLGRLAVPRYVVQTAEKLRARLPREVGGYGYGLEPRPVFDALGRVREPARTPVEDLANALGLQSVPQAEAASAQQAQARFEQAERARRSLASREGYQRLRDALERGDRAAVVEAERQLTPGQLREFYRESWRTPTERRLRRLPRETRERFRQEFAPAPAGPPP